MRITEAELIDVLNKAKYVALIEPPYRRKYIPLGLAKIKSYLEKRGCKVRYMREYTHDSYDLILVTSLFTYYSSEVFKELSKIQFWAPSTKTIVGGILASIMPSKIEKMFPSFPVFVGTSKVLDQEVPDYSFDWGVKGKFEDACLFFTQRGCINKCPYCVVPKIESEHYIIPSWKKQIKDMGHIVCYDNNPTALDHDHIINVLHYLAEFTDGKKGKVIFDSGFDCKHMTPEFAAELSKIPFARNGMKLAFDRIEEDTQFQAAAQMIVDAGIPKKARMAYVLFNFRDSVQEADYRARTVLKYGFRPYPQRYTPLNRMSLKPIHISKKWTMNLLMAFRFYWLFDVYTHMDFEEYITGGGSRKFTFNDEDIEKYYSFGM